MRKWTVCKREGRWRVYDNNTWSDTFDTLPQAHSWAMACAISDWLYEPGGLTRIKELFLTENLAFFFANELTEIWTGEIECTRS